MAKNLFLEAGLSKKLNEYDNAFYAKQQEKAEKIRKEQEAAKIQEATKARSLEQAVKMQDVWSPRVGSAAVRFRSERAEKAQMDKQRFIAAAKEGYNARHPEKVTEQQRKAAEKQNGIQPTITSGENTPVALKYKNDPVVQKYGINPSMFDADALDKWKREHSGALIYTGGDKMRTREEDNELARLKEIAAYNEEMKKSTQVRLKNEQYTKKREAQRAELESVTNAEDFAEYSEKGRTAKESAAQRAMGFRANYIENINNNGGTLNDELIPETKKYSKLTEKERGVYNYYLGKYGSKKAKEYLKFIDRDLNERQAAEDYKLIQDFSNKHIAGGAVLNVANSLAGGAGYAATAAQAAKNLITGEYEPVDINGPSFSPIRAQQASEEGITRDMSSAGKFLADTGLSIGQNMVQTVLLGGVGGWAPLATMSLNAAGSTSYDATKRGATTGQAFALGTAAGAVEAATEKIPLDNILKMAKGPTSTARGFFVNIGKQMFNEASEETISEYANTMVDQLVMGNGSEYNEYKRELMAQGMSEAEADKQAKLQFLLYNPALAGLGGALSGGVMGAGAQAVGAVNTTKAGRQINNSGEGLSVLLSGLEAEDGSAARVQAEKIAKRLSEGKDASDYSVGALYGELAEGGRNVFRGRFAPEKAAWDARRQAAITRPANDRVYFSENHVPKVERTGSAENLRRFSENVDKVFKGELPERAVVTIGNTPQLLQKYGASNLPITIDQSVMYKVAYPRGYFGAEKDGHNLGIPALKQLPTQISDPVAILRSNSQENSFVLLTEWEDTNKNPVIIPLHLDKNGALGITNEVASAYGKINIEPLLTDKDGNSTVLCTKNNENIHQLIQSRLQLPGALTDDTLIAKYIIPQNSENSNTKNISGGAMDSAENIDADGTQTHTPEQIRIMQEYENAVDDDLLDFVQRAKENPKDNKTVFVLNDVSERMADDVEGLTGIDVSGFGNTIKNNSITHIENDHGAKGKTDNSMADDNDIARIQYVLDNYDDIELLNDVSREYRDKNQKPAPIIKISKRIDGTYYVVEAVPDTNKHQLAVISAYKNKAVEQEMGAAQSHDPNVRNASTDTAFNGSIPQSAENNNSLGKNNGQAQRSNRLDTAQHIQPMEESNTNKIQVSTKESAELVKNFNAARKTFVEHARNNFPASVVNVNTNKEIGISRNGIDKFLSGNITAEKLASGYEIPKLIETAVKVGEADNQKSKDNINGYEYYYNTIEIDGEPYAAHIRVRNTNMGDKYYGHTISRDISSIEIEPLARVHNEKSSSRPVKEASDSNNIIIPQNLENSNSLGKNNGQAQRNFRKNSLSDAQIQAFSEFNSDGEYSNPTATAATANQRAAKDMARRLGYDTIFFDDGGAGVNGAINGRTVFINRSAENPAMQVLGHEAVHGIMADTEAKAELIDILKKETTAREDFQQRFKKKKEQYRAHIGEELSDDYIWEEFAADIGGELFMDDNFIERVTRENRTFAQKIVNFFKDIIARIKGTRFATGGENLRYVNDINKVIRKYEKAFERGSTANSTSDNGVRYDIVTLDNGKEYVEATRQVILGDNVSDWRKSITSFFNEMLENGSIDIKNTDGSTLTITKDTANKARDNYKYENGKKVKMADSEFLVKLHAESHIDELSEISRAKNSRNDEKRHGFAKDGFTYRDVLFKDFNGEYYKITLSVGENSGISTVYNVGKIKTDRTPTGRTTSRRVGQSPIASLSDKYSIANPSEKVKSKKSLKEDSRFSANTPENGGVRYSLVGKNKDNIEVYETSEEIKKLPYKEKRKKFLDVMKNEYRGRTARFEINGNYYYATFESNDVRKNIYGDNMSDKKGYRAKINAGADGDIFDLVENAQYLHSAAEEGKTNIAHKDITQWDYFIKKVQIDGYVYDLLANVRKTPDNQFVYGIQLNQDTKTTASPLTRAKNSSVNRVPNAVALDDSIPNPDEKVKPDIKKSLKKDSRFRTNTLERSTMLTEADIAELEPSAFEYIPESTGEWESAAVENVRRDMGAVMEKIRSADSISGGVMAHEAAIISQKLLDNYRESGSSADFAKMKEWTQTVAEKTRETARALKATDSAWDKSPAAAVAKAQGVVDKVNDAIDKENPKAKRDRTAQGEKIKKDLSEIESTGVKQILSELDMEISELDTEISRRTKPKSRKASPVSPDARDAAGFEAGLLNRLGIANKTDEKSKRQSAFAKRIASDLFGVLEKRFGGNAAGGGKDGMRYSIADSGEGMSIKAQIMAKADILNNMNVVVAVDNARFFNSVKQAKGAIIQELKSSGYKIDRQGFGVIEFDERMINEALNYLDTPAEFAAFAALPKVLKRGVRIDNDSHLNHKNRGYGTITIGAPIELNGKRGNMAVVVKMTNKNKYKMHRILMPDGSAFILDEKRNNAEPASAHSETELADPHTVIVSNNSILNPDENVKKFSLTDTQQRQFDRYASDIREAIEGRGEYAEMWQTAREYAAELYGDNAEAMEIVDEYFQTGEKQTAGRLDRAIRLAMTDMDVDVNEVIREYYTKGAATEQALYDYLLDKTGLSENDAAELSRRVSERYRVLVQKKKDAYLKRVFGERKKFTDRRALDRISEIINSGAFEKSGYADRVGERINPLIAKYLKEKGVNIGEVVKQGAKNTASEQRELLDRLFSELDGRISDEDKARFNAVAEEEFSRLTQVKRDKLLRGMFGLDENGGKRAAQRQKSTQFERLIEMINLGAFEENSIIDDVLKEKAGLPTLDRADVDYITEHIEKAHRFEEGSREYAVEAARVKARMESKLKAPAASKIKSLARIAMLGNMKTIISRNALSNAIMSPVYNAENIIAAPIDKALSKFAGTQRTASLPSFTKQARGFGKGAYEAFDDYRKGIKTRTETGRYDIEGPAAWQNKGAQKVLYKADKLVGFVLDAGDRPFYEAYFNDVLNQQMRANKNKEPTADMIKTAAETALSRTWQDTNNYTKAIKNLKRFLNLVNIKGYGLGDVVVPFEATPANLLRSLVEHSPAGLAKSLTADAAAFADSARKGSVTPQIQRAFVDKITSGISGTLIYLAAVALAKRGVLRGGGDDDKDAAAYRQYVEGKQPNSLNIGGKSITIDWAQPIGSLMSAGADTVKAAEENAGAFDTIIKALKSGGETLLETTVLQGVRDFFGSYSATQGVVDAFFDMPMQFMPSIVKQTADIADDTARSTYDPSSLGSLKRQIMNKTPFVSKSLEPRLNVWGEEQERIKGGNTAFNSYLNPAYITNIKDSKINGELDDLYEKTGDAGIYPKVADKKITYDGRTYQLTPKQYTEYQRNLGSKTLEMYKKLIEEDAVVSEIFDEDKGKIKLSYDEMDDKQRKQAERSIRADIRKGERDADAVERFQAGEIEESVNFSYKEKYSQMNDKVRAKVLKKVISDVNDSVKAKMRGDVIKNGVPRFQKRK